MKRQLNHWWLPLLILIVIGTTLFSRAFFDSSLGFPDADRILMDGVFIHDFLHDLPLSHPYQYTVNYYGQYPALSIGYRPPFFPFVESIFNTLFGVNMWSSRLALLMFGVIGIISWFALIRRIFDDSTAFFSTLLFITLPFIAKWGWYTMTELPLLSLTLLTLYLFYRYVETNSPRFLLFTTITFIATVWTKQPAFYLAFFFILYLWHKKVLVERLKERKTWLAILGIIVLLAPLAAITLWLGDQNLIQSIGVGIPPEESTWLLRWERLPLHFRNMLHYQMNAPLLALAALGMLWAFIKKEQKALFFGLFILVTFVFFSYIIHKNARYTIFWIPSFALFAALPLYFLKTNPKVRNAYAAVLVALSGYQVHLIYSYPPSRATGYDLAAKYVLEHSHSPTMLVDAYNNGYFTYFMRSLDPKRSMYVLRADKLLTSSSISSFNRLNIHVKDREGIRKLLDKYGVELIVVESRDVSNIGIHRELRRYLAEGPFEELTRIPVETTRYVLKNQELIVYRYKDYQPAEGGILELHLPVVGQTLRVPVTGRPKSMENR